MGNRNRCIQQMMCVGNTDVFCFGFYFMSPKWTRTKIVIVISLSLQTFCSLLLVQRSYRFLCTYLEVLISALFSLYMAMRIVFSTFWFAIFIFGVLKCVVVNFVRYSLAGTNGMSISDILVFFSIICYMGIIQLPAKTDYWK